MLPLLCKGEPEREVEDRARVRLELDPPPEGEGDEDTGSRETELVSDNRRNPAARKMKLTI